MHQKREGFALCDGTLSIFRGIIASFVTPYVVKRSITKVASYGIIRIILLILRGKSFVLWNATDQLCGIFVPKKNIQDIQCISISYSSMTFPPKCIIADSYMHDNECSINYGHVNEQLLGKSELYSIQFQGPL